MIQPITSLAGLLGDGVSETVPSAAKPDLIPFQKFLDAAVEHLNEVSGQEAVANGAVQSYLAGNGSLEDAVFALNELSSSVQLANQVLTSAVSTFREIEQMQI